MSLAVPTSLAGSFLEPVFDSQRAFRAAMDALATPGVIQPAGRGLPETPLPAAAAALVLSLCDYETPLYLGRSIEALPSAPSYLRFHSDAMLVTDPAMAAFAVIDLVQDGLDLAVFAQGTPEYPDRSTTVIALTPSLTDGPALTFTGPGIASTATLRVAGLPADFAQQWNANRAAFPLGVDMIFATSDAVVGLPRSARLSKDES
jgi:alpha-D-ribose 1-methylphosphonate 5-triphosphate synthase subunit PhnH